MNIAKLRKRGDEQLVVLTENFHMLGDEVYIKKVNNTIVLIPKNDHWMPLWDSLTLFSKDFMSSRFQPKLQVREDLFL